MLNLFQPADPPSPHVTKSMQEGPNDSHKPNQLFNEFKPGINSRDNEVMTLVN